MKHPVAWQFDRITSSYENQPLLIYCKHNFSAVPKKEAILFIHGFPDSHETWQFQLEDLGQDYFVAAFDLRGVGQSQTPADKKGFQIEAVLKDFNAVIEHLNKINNQIDGFHIVSHDWGALLSWSYIAHEPYAKNIKSLTALGGLHPGFMLQNNLKKLTSKQIKPTLSSLEQILKSWYVGFFQIPIISELSFTFADQWLFKQILKAAEVPAQDAMWSISNEKLEANVENAINLYRQLLQGPKVEAPKKLIETPVLQFVLQKDIFIAPQTYEGLESLCRNYKVKNFQGNHWAHRSHAKSINAAIKEFIELNS